MPDFRQARPLRRAALLNKEENMPDVYYARPSNFLSDSRDKTVITGGSEDEVLEKMYEYLRSPEAQARYPNVDDPTELEFNIRKCIFRKGDKLLGTRAPDAHH